MQYCLLPSALLATHPAKANTRRIVWDAWDVDGEDISLCREMNSRLIALRSEHAAWAYETGLVQTPRGSVATLFEQGSTLSAWWCSILYERHPKVSPALYQLYLLRTVELLLLEGACSSLEVHGLDPVACGMLETLCKARGWGFAADDLASPRPVSRLRRIYAATPAPLRALVRLGVWLVQVKRHLKRTRLAETAVPSGTIATYFPNIDLASAKEGAFRSRYWESLHTLLNGQKDIPVRWLFIRFPSPQGSLQQCVAWARTFAQKARDGISFNYLEEFLDTDDMIHAFVRYARIARTSLALEGDLRARFVFRDSRLNFWPLLGSDYVESFRGWRCLERCLQQRGLENYVREAGPQAWYTFPMENCPWERMLTHAAHELGTGPVYGAQHSTIRPTDFRYFDDPRTWEDPATRLFQPDKIAGNGESACSQWRQNRVPQERLTMVEALRYLYLADKVASATSFARHILVVTSFFADETEAHIRLLADCLKQGLLTAEEITIKPHPYLPVEPLLATYLGDAPKPEVTNTPLPEMLASHPIVWASNSTTAVLEAALMGLPVLVMRPVGDFDLCPLQDIAGLTRTSDVESVRKALENPSPLNVAGDYLCLDKNLPRWRLLLGLKDAASPAQQ